MTKTVDQPFQSKAERELEKALTEQYREIGNSELADAVKQQQAASKQTPPQLR